MPDERAEFIAGLRALADFYEADPEFPLPFEARHDADSEYTVHGIYDAETLAELTRRLGGPRRKEYSENSLQVFRRFGPGVHLSLYASRDQVCERIKVGTKTVTKPDPNALIEVEEDVYEWRCHDSLLGIDESAEVTS